MALQNSASVVHVNYSEHRDCCENLTAFEKLPFVLGGKNVPSLCVDFN